MDDATFPDPMARVIKLEELLKFFESSIFMKEIFDSALEGDVFSIDKIKESFIVKKLKK